MEVKTCSPFFAQRKQKMTNRKLSRKHCLQTMIPTIGWLTHYVKNPEDAGDIVQEGAYQAIKKCRTLEKPEYVKTWLYRLMLNEVFSFCRKKHKTVSTEEVVTGAMDGGSLSGHGSLEGAGCLGGQG